MKAKILRACALASVIFVAAPCQATTVYVSYTGTVTGTDTLGFFGQAGAQLTGTYEADYVFNVVYDVNINNHQVGNGTTSKINQIDGGTEFSSTSPVTSTKFILHGVTITMDDGSYYGIIHGENEGGPTGLTEQYDEAYSGGTGINIINQIQNFSGASSGIPSSIETAFTYTVNVHDDSPGLFCESHNTDCLNLRATTLTVTIGATPLPAALPLFATGLGGLGLLGWRRKRRNAAAVAA